jgi:hypothetical protein
VLLVKCPSCGKEQNNPEKSIRNCVFEIEAYTCSACGCHFKKAKEVYGLLSQLVAER